MPVGVALPRGDYYAFVKRGDRPTALEVYPWSIRQALPKFRIPLKSPDQDVALDLSTAFKTSYDNGRYDRTLRYGLPLPSTLGEADRAWASERARTQLR